MDTISWGTLCQLAGPWKLFEVRFFRFTFLYIVLQTALCTLANHICALHLNCYSKLANFISYSCKLYMCSVSCKLYMCSCFLQTVPNLQTIYVLYFLQTVSIFFFCSDGPWPMPYLLVGLMWTWRPLPWCESILMVLPLTWQAKLSSFSFFIIIYVSLGSFFDKTCYANHLLTLGWASSCCCPKLGGDCYYLFSNFSAIRGCLPKGLISCWVSGQPTGGYRRASSAYGSSSFYACPIFHVQG